MKTLVVPDVHEKIKTLIYLEPVIDRAERVVFLGDWFDNYGKDRDVETAWWLKKRLRVPRFTFLLGNHDCQYVFNNRLFTCSGFSWQKKQRLMEIMTHEDWALFKIYTEAEGFLLSHAGFCPETYHLATSAMHEKALEVTFSGGMSWMWAAGIARGGWEEKGGPIWLDWNREFEPVPGVKQIVGHTHAKDGLVRVRDGNYCIDTGLKHVAWIEGGKIEIERLHVGELEAA